MGYKSADVAFQPYKNFMVLGFTIRVPKSAELSQYQIQSLRMKLLPTVSKFKLCRIPLKIDTIWMVENSRHTCTKYRFYYDQIFYCANLKYQIWRWDKEQLTCNKEVNSVSYILSLLETFNMLTCKLFLKVSWSRVTWYLLPKL